MTPMSQRRRRHDAALRLQPLDSGLRDPDYPNTPRPPMSPSTAAYVAYIGGSLTADEARTVWQECPGHRDMLEAYATSHAAGWPA